jgi:hypothetical protein
MEIPATPKPHIASSVSDLLSACTGSSGHFICSVLSGCSSSIPASPLPIRDNILQARAIFGIGRLRFLDMPQNINF